jgi:hypothetical protein
MLTALLTVTALALAPVAPEPVPTPDRIDEILKDDEFIDSLNGGNPTDGWGNV